MRRCKKMGKVKRKRYRYEQSHRVVDGVKEKRCHKCRRWKPESKFSKKRKRKDGLQQYCKECSSKVTRRYYRQNRKSVRKYYIYEQSHRVTDGVKEKRCRKCSKWKAESKFYKNRNANDRLNSWCKECGIKATSECRRRRLAHSASSLIRQSSER